LVNDVAFDECGRLSLSPFSVATSPLLISDSEDLRETEQRGANVVADLFLPPVAVVGVVVAAGRLFPRILARQCDDDAPYPIHGAAAAAEEEGGGDDDANVDEMGMIGGGGGAKAEDVPVVAAAAANSNAIGNAASSEAWDDDADDGCPPRLLPRADDIVVGGGGGGGGGGRSRI
jgi:hypothetical protein